MTASVARKESIQVQSDVALNDSDKSFTVPAGSLWELLSVQVELTPTATAGNRQMTVEIQDGSSNVLHRALAGAVAAATEVRQFNFGPGLADQTAFRDTDELTTPLPPLRLAPGHVIRVYDRTAVDAAADDMEVRVLVDRRSA